MDVLCDDNVLSSLVHDLKQDSYFDVDEVTNYHSSPVSESDVHQCAHGAGRVLITGTYRFLRNSTSYGVIFYHDPSASNAAIICSIKNISQNPHSDINRAIP